MAEEHHTQRSTSDSGVTTQEELRFPSGDGSCAATVFWPRAYGSGDLPAVVMANGGGMTRGDGLPRFAERFAEAGFVAVTFDFRHLGDSDGAPRQLLDHDRHRADLTAAVAFARGLSGVDAERVALWGFSYNGGHVVRVAAEDGRLAAAVAMCPIVNRLAFTRYGDRGSALRLAAEAVRAAFARRPVHAPLVGPAGSLTLLAQPEAQSAMEALAAADSRWRNELRASPFKPAALFRPVRHARRVGCPLMVILGLHDTVVPPRPIERVAARAPRAELHRYPVNHFGGFLDGFDDVVRDQIDFLTRHLGSANSD